jgi:hypothetical protein
MKSYTGSSLNGSKELINDGSLNLCKNKLLFRMFTVHKAIIN